MHVQRTVNQMTLKSGVEMIIKKHVPEIEKVIIRGLMIKTDILILEQVLGLVCSF